MHINFKYLLPVAMLATAFSGSAVPAYPGLLERTLEDGSKVMIRLNGDEYFHYITDEHGFLLDETDGGLSYRMREGARVMATESVLEQMRAKVEATEPVKMMRAAEMQRMASLDRQGRTTFCTTGDVHFLVLLVQYDDVKFNSPTIREDMMAMLNEEGYTRNGATGSVRDYYMSSSNGNFRPTFDVSEVITLPKTSAYYVGADKYDNVHEMVADAVSLADPYVDFSKYCNVKPGVCDAVILWYAGYSQADTYDKTCIWPHQGSVSMRNIVADDTRIEAYCCFNELNGGQHYYNKDGAMAGIGTPIHEFGHVMGMPDLYDPYYKVKSTPGSWSTFDMGPYLGDGYCPPSYSGYERWVFNWIEYEDVVDATHYDLAALTDKGKVLRIPVKNTSGTVWNNEYFLLESRHKASWDKYLPGEGLLIWHVDYNATSWYNNTVNSQESRKRCHLITADGSANYNLGNTNKSSDNAAWPQDIDYITPDTQITLNTNYLLAASATGNSFITGIRHDSETGVSSFDYNIITESPRDVTVLATPVRGTDRNGNPNEEITLSWDKVEGATGYMLTVYRTSGGKIYYENGLDEENVGNVTTYTLPALSRTKMGLEFTAYVRVINGIPSIEKSNEVTFVPNDLETSSGVDEVFGQDTVVIGLKGAIQAPEGAEIYNMQGVRCPAEGLAPGVYVVRFGQTVTKAVVK